jgi:hypothetical protein
VFRFGAKFEVRTFDVRVRLKADTTFGRVRT